MSVSRKREGVIKNKQHQHIISSHFQEDFKLTVQGEKREMIKADSKHNPQQHYRARERDKGRVIKKEKKTMQHNLEVRCEGI